MLEESCREERPFNVELKIPMTENTDDGVMFLFITSIGSEEIENDRSVIWNPVNITNGLTYVRSGS
jgi:hypothetical protein